jgi:hypothetical protein
MGFTELVKRTARRAGAKVKWYVWLIMPSVLAAIGVGGMVRGQIIERNMALIVWFTVSFAGPILYEYVFMPGLRKLKK